MAQSEPNLGILDNVVVAHILIFEPIKAISRDMNAITSVGFLTTSVEMRNPERPVCRERTRRIDEDVKNLIHGV